MPRPIDLFLEKTKAFALARALMTCLDLDLFPWLPEGGATESEIVFRFGLNPALTGPLLRLLAAGGVLEYAEGRYRPTAVSRSVLENYSQIKSWNEEMTPFYRLLGDLTPLLRDEALWEERKRDYFSVRSDPDRFSRAMDESLERISEEVLARLDLTGVGTLIDMGGGHGRLAVELARRYPRLRVTVVDLPGVIAGTKRKVEGAGLADRIECLGMDFFSGRLPGKADVVTFCRILTDWGDAEARRLLGLAADLTEPGRGEVWLIETLFASEGPADEGACATALMAALLGGRRRSVGDCQVLLAEAGFGDFRVTDLDWGLFRVLRARRK